MNTTRWSIIYAVGSGLIGFAELIIGWLSGSVALIADSIHSITDVLAGFIGAIATRVGRQKADANHPFGHSRAEPLGAFIIALLTSILGLNILQMGVTSLIEKQQVNHGSASYWVLAGVLVFKGAFFLLAKRKRDSVMLRALSLDSRNDCLASFATLIIIFASSHGVPWIDQSFALIIGVTILYSGIQIARQNIAMLMGETPENAFFENLDHTLQAIPEVLSYRQVKAHYVGLDIHLALTILLDPQLTLSQAHRIEHMVTEKLLQLPHLAAVFAHIEPNFQDQ